MATQTEATALSSYVADTLTHQLAKLTSSPQALVVGFSGGVDSTLLVHIAANYARQHQLPIHAVYVNHGLSVHADKWQAHCAAFCKQQQVVFHSERVNVANLPRKSLEASARDARYAVLLEYCRQHRGTLLLGQHQDDQLESLLLALKRGSGPAGVAAMPFMFNRDGVDILRPLLDISRATIEHVAQQLGLSWINDESNANNRFDRNFLRNEIIPQLKQRWPDIADTAFRSSQLIAEQNAMLEEVAADYYKSVVSDAGGLAIPALSAYSQQWQRAICRYWLAKQHLQMPRFTQLKQILVMCDARDDAQPQVDVGSYTVRRHNNELLACLPLSPATMQRVEAGNWQTLPWWPVSFFINSGESVWHAAPMVTFDKLFSERQQVSKPPRKWLKEWSVPPWERDNIPVLCFNNKPVVAVLKTSLFWFVQQDSVDVRIR